MNSANGRTCYYVKSDVEIEYIIFYLNTLLGICIHDPMFVMELKFSVKDLQMSEDATECAKAKFD